MEQQPMIVGAPELSKFERKAEAYRRALRIAPYARSLEVIPLLAYLKGLTERLGLRKRDLRIVDLMSGDGHLSGILWRQGYRRLHAVESCNEMSFDAPAYEKVRLSSPPDAVKALRVVRQINPHVVVSLAAFHHLIETTVEGEIDLAGSQAWQASVVENAFNEAPGLILFLIVDLSEATGLWSLDRLGLWSGLSEREGRELDASHYDELADIYRAKSFAEFASAVDRAFLRHVNSFSLKWFRDVVDTQTEIGHKDVAISDALIERLSHQFTVSHRRYVCPWHFDGEEQLGTFLHDKFGFSIGDTAQTPDMVRQLARDEHLVIARSGMESLLWDLGIVAIERPGAKLEPTSFLDRLYVFPGGSLALGLVYFALTLYGQNPQLSAWVLSAWCVMFGGTVKWLLGDGPTSRR